MKVTILGCGGSGGVPLIGNIWGECDPKEPRNRRRRVSILVEEGDTSLLVDCSPDLREQFLDAGIDRLSGVVLTHAHADHVHGIDDLRSINALMQAPLPLYATAETLEEIGRRFGYAVKPPAKPPTFYRPVLTPMPITDGFTLGAIGVRCFEQDHGYGKTLGLRFGPVAYSTDVVRLPEEAFAVLEGVDTWIVDCLRMAPHPTHAHFDRVLKWVERVRPRRTVLTHMGHLMDYRRTAERCPPGVVPAHDGMVLDV